MQEGTTYGTQRPIFGFFSFSCVANCETLRTPVLKDIYRYHFALSKESFSFFVSSLGLVIELAIRCRFSTIHSQTRLIFWQPTNYAEHQFDGGQIQFRSQTCKMIVHHESIRYGNVKLVLIY